MKMQKEAELFIGELEGFDLEDFKEVYSKISKVVGSNNIKQYIEEKKRWQNIVSCETIIGNISYSRQARGLLNYVTIDKEDFERWFSNAVSIGVNDIINYMEYKEVAREQLIKRLEK